MKQRKLEMAYLELAALFPTPSRATLEDAKAVCSNNNEADAQCILNAFLMLRVLTGRLGKKSNERR